MKSKYIKIFIVLFLIILIGYCLLKIYNKKELPVLKEVTIEVFGDLPKLDDYIIKYGDLSKGASISVLDDANESVGVYDVLIDGKYNTKLNVIDTVEPEIKLKEVTITEGDKVEVKDFVESCVDNSKKDCKYITENENNEFNLGVGKHDIKVTAIDESGNKKEATTKLIVNKKEVVNKNNEVSNSKTNNGFEIKLINGITYVDGYLIANKTYPLTSSYGNGITKDTNDAFKKMSSAASSENINLFIVSGYRSYDSQKSIYNNYVARDGKNEADTYSARPGHSEHQTGLALDLNSLYKKFEYDKEGIWLNNNCYKYGFIIRYPKGKDEITGYMYEPWHIRYVGVDLATKLYNNGNWITMEEYFGIDSKYKN